MDSRSFPSTRLSPTFCSNTPTGSFLLALRFLECKRMGSGDPFTNVPNQQEHILIGRGDLEGISVAMTNVSGSLVLNNNKLYRIGSQTDLIASIRETYINRLSLDGRFVVGSVINGKQVVVYHVDSINDEGGFDQVDRINLDTEQSIWYVRALNQKGDVAILYNDADKLLVVPLR